MTKARRIGAWTVAVSLLWAAVAGCDTLGPDLSTDAEIRFSDIEGGCWMVDTSERSYEPINLPEAFKVDGLAVRIEAELVSDRGSFCTGPPYLDIKRIEQSGR